jgi:hypothetical protein
MFIDSAAWLLTREERSRAAPLSRLLIIWYKFRLEAGVARLDRQRRSAKRSDKESDHIVACF